MGILFLIVNSFSHLVIGTIIFGFLNQVRDSKILANVIYSLGLSALLLIGLPTLPLFFLRKLKAGVQELCLWRDFPLPRGRSLSITGFRPSIDSSRDLKRPID